MVTRIRPSYGPPRDESADLTQPLVISIDAMGGDHGPSVTIPALDRALKELPGDVRFLLHGDEAMLKAELRPASRRSRTGRSAPRRPRHRHGREAAQAMRRGKGSSMWNAGRSDPRGRGRGGAFGREHRGPDGHFTPHPAHGGGPGAAGPGRAMPHERGFTTFLDAGANVDLRRRAAGRIRDHGRGLSSGRLWRGAAFGRAPERRLGGDEGPREVRQAAPSCAKARSTSTTTASSRATTSPRAGWTLSSPTASPATSR
jgi:hypothetical protein